MTHIDTVRVADVLAQYGPGDSGDQLIYRWGWREEFAQLWIDDATHMHNLLVDIKRHGIREPILLGNDGRLWDGHHRLAIAVALVHDTIPAEHAAKGVL